MGEGTELTQTFFMTIFPQIDEIYTWKTQTFAVHLSNVPANGPPKKKLKVCL